LSFGNQIFLTIPLIKSQPSDFAVLIDIVTQGRAIGTDLPDLKVNLIFSNSLI